MFTGTLSGPALIAALETELESIRAAIAKQLRPYDRIVTPQRWHRILQGAEELINFVFNAHEDVATQMAVISMPLADAIGQSRNQFESLICKLYDGDIEIHIIEYLKIVQNLVEDSANCGRPIGESIRTVGDVAVYAHSRRRRMVALLYIMPQICRGKVEASKPQDFLTFMNIIEHAAGSAIGFVHSRMMAYSFKYYQITSNGTTLHPNRKANLLDEGAFDPERVSIEDMIQHGTPAQMPVANHLEPRLLLSKAEAEYQINMYEPAYNEFELDKTSFRALRDLLLPLLKGTDAHIVKVPAEPFLAAVNAVRGRWPDINQAILVHDGSDLSTALYAHQPFILIENELVSNVTLITRFMNDWKNRVLGRKKRYQIRSGFLFERKVKKELSEHGFAIVHNTKRIHKREFDVITIKNDIIHNFQCKNTSLDDKLINGDPRRYARYNKAVANSHRRAIEKEIEREHLLKNKFNISEVRHYVVTRFPVLCDDNNIIPFAEFPRWLRDH